MLESIYRDGILGDQDGQGSIEYMILAVAAVELGFLVFTLIKNVVQGHQGDLPKEDMQEAERTQKLPVWESGILHGGNS